MPFIPLSHRNESKSFESSRHQVYVPPIRSIVADKLVGAIHTERLLDAHRTRLLVQGVVSLKEVQRVRLVAEGLLDGGHSGGLGCWIGDGGPISRSRVRPARLGNDDLLAVGNGLKITVRALEPGAIIGSRVRGVEEPMGLQQSAVFL